MAKRYRYIFCGLVNPDSPISDYRLVASSGFSDTTASAIRFEVPSDMKLETCVYDGYSSTEDTRTLNRIGYDIIIKHNGRWKVCNQLKQKVYDAKTRELQMHCIYFLE